MVHLGFRAVQNPIDVTSSAAGPGLPLPRQRWRCANQGDLLRQKRFLTTSSLALAIWYCDPLNRDQIGHTAPGSTNELLRPLLRRNLSGLFKYYGISYPEFIRSLCPSTRKVKCSFFFVLSVGVTGKFRGEQYYGLHGHNVWITGNMICSIIQVHVKKLTAVIYLYTWLIDPTFELVRFLMTWVE